MKERIRSIPVITGEYSAVKNDSLKKLVLEVAVIRLYISFADGNSFVRKTAWMLLLVSVLVGSSSAFAEDFILRASSECCKEYPNFAAGSKALLIRNGKIIAESDLSEPGPFVFKNIKVGEYDIIVSAAGSYPSKFTNLRIGENKVFDFELVATLRSLSASILEGQLVIRFQPRTSDRDIIRRLEKWELGPQPTSRDETGSKSLQYKIDRSSEYSEVRVAYDIDKNLVDIMMTVLSNPTVIECVPIYFSLGK